MNEPITIRNEFTSRSITVDAGRPLTAAKIRSWRKKLHAHGCTSGDDLGGRGPQADPPAYERLLMRAIRVRFAGDEPHG